MLRKLISDLLAYSQLAQGEAPAQHARIPGIRHWTRSLQRIVEQYRGRIVAESRPGEGSTFWLTVPVSVSDVGRFEAHASAPTR